jgi:uncharacterized protein (DUF4213/DUF364 family)
MADICKKIIQFLQESGKEDRGKEVCIGLGYTAVQLESDRTGVAFTFRQDFPGGCSVFNGLRPLSGRKAGDLLPLLDSNEKIEAVDMAGYFGPLVPKLSCRPLKTGNATGEASSVAGGKKSR